MHVHGRSWKFCVNMCKSVNNLLREDFELGVVVDDPMAWKDYIVSPIPIWNLELGIRNRDF